MLFPSTYGPSYVAPSLGYGITSVSRPMLLWTVQSLASCVHTFYSSSDAPYRFCIMLSFCNRSLLIFVTCYVFTKLLLAINNEELVAGYFSTAQKIKTRVSVRKFLRLRGRKWVLIFKIKDGNLPGLNLLLSKVSFREVK